MSTRYTKKDIRTAVEALESLAKTIGVMPNEDGTRLVYSPGNSSQGISASIECYHTQENGHRNTVSVRFLPEFTYKSTLREQFKMVQAAHGALYAVAMMD